MLTSFINIIIHPYHIGFFFHCFVSHFTSWSRRAGTDEWSILSWKNRQQEVPSHSAQETKQSPVRFSLLQKVAGNTARLFDYENIRWRTALSSVGVQSHTYNDPFAYASRISWFNSIARVL